MPQHGCFEVVADFAGVGEVLAAGGVFFLEDGAGVGEGLFRGGVAGVLAHGLEDLQELVGVVVFEVYVFVEAGAQAGVGVDEAGHELGVAGDDDDEVVAVVFHGFEEGVDGFAAVVVAAGGVGEGVGFVDEEDAAYGFIDDFLDFEGGLADVAGDQAGAVDFHEGAFGEDAHGVVDLGQEAAFSFLKVRRVPM